METKDEEGGFRCSNCHSRFHKVTNTWQHSVKWQGRVKTIIRRRRVCEHCGLPFTTIETHEEDVEPLMEKLPRKKPTIPKESSPKEDEPRNPFI